MFAVKPPTAKQEFAELHQLLGSVGLAEVLNRRLESVSRLRTRKSYTRPLERLIDDVWSVAHVATVQAEWEPERVRSFFLLRQPEFALKTAADLIREGQTTAVLDAVRTLRVVSVAPLEPTNFSRAALAQAEPAAPTTFVRRTQKDPAKRASAQKRLAERGLQGLDRERLIAAGHEAWGGGTSSQS